MFQYSWYPSISFFFLSSRRRHTRSLRDWSSDVCSSDLPLGHPPAHQSVGDEQVLPRERAALLIEVQQVAGVQWHVAVADVGDGKHAGIAGALDRDAMGVQEPANAFGGDLVGVVSVGGGL